MKKIKYKPTTYYEDPQIRKKMDKALSSQQRSRFIRSLTKKGLEELK